MYEDILFPVNEDRKELEKVAKHVMSHAQDGTENIHIIHVDVAEDTEYAPSLGETESHEIFDDVCSKLPDRTNCITERLKGNPSESIIDYVAENDIDLVVMGTHARDGIRRLIFGSVAEDVMRNASSPVLIVHV
jgi:nucleotide-binding universal stress UspA family protein